MTVADPVRGVEGMTVTKPVRIVEINQDAIDDIQNGLATSTALSVVDADTSKIDDASTDGLSGTSNSLAYRVEEVEKHLHNWETWFGAALVPNGEIHVADRITNGPSEFQADAGNNTWGSWLQVIGSSDTPARSGMAKYDVHRLLITAVERTGHHFVQIAFGESGNAGLAAEEYTEFIFRPQTDRDWETS